MPASSALVLIPTFALTIFKDLTFGIVTGCLIAALLAGIDRWRQGPNG
jgi:SulP family sulfate permease